MCGVSLVCSLPENGEAVFLLRERYSDFTARFVLRNRIRDLESSFYVATMEIGIWTMVCDGLNGAVPERRVTDEDVCQAGPEESGTP
jgi:hypothetical protein